MKCWKVIGEKLDMNAEEGTKKQRYDLVLGEKLYLSLGSVI